MSTSKHKPKMLHSSKAARIRGLPRVHVQNLIVLAHEKHSLKLSARHLRRSKYSLKIDSTRRTSFKMLPPIRFIDLIPKYRTVGDLCIICKTGKFDPEDIYSERMKDFFMPLNAYKRFTKAEYFERSGIFSLNLISFKNDFFPVKLVVERLESLQDKDAYEVAKLVKVYNKSLKERKREREESRRVLKEKLHFESLKISSVQVKEAINLMKEGVLPNWGQSQQQDMEMKEEFRESREPRENKELRHGEELRDSAPDTRGSKVQDPSLSSSSSSRGSNFILVPQVASSYFQREYRCYEEYMKKNESIIEQNKNVPMIIFTTEESEGNPKLLYEIKKLAFNTEFVRLVNPDGDVRLNLNILNTGIPPVIICQGNYFCTLKQLLEGMISHKFKIGDKKIINIEIRTLDGMSLKASLNAETTTFEGLNYDEITTFLKLEINDDDKKRLERLRINNRSRGVELQITSFYHDAIQNNLLKTTEFLNKCYPGAIPQNMMEQNSKKVCGFKMISEN